LRVEKPPPMPSRRLLVVTYDFPPSPLVGGVRWSSMSKYLTRLGHDVTVVTTDGYGVLPEDSDRVIRPASLESSRMLRRLLRRPDSSPSSVGSGGGRGPSRVMNLLVPDPWVVSWAPFALRAAWPAVRRRTVDCVITTSPGESTHLVGLALQRLGPAWVADFRDGWLFEPARPSFPLPGLPWIDARLERLVVGHADVTVAVTDELVEDFRTRLHVEAVEISNGFDPELEDETARQPDSHEPRGADRVRLVYTGRIGVGTARRRPEGFLRALERFVELDPELARRLEVVIAGPTTSSDRERLASSSLRALISHVGQVDHSESVRLQSSADVLVLLGSDSSVATAKLFEYLGSRRPILHTGGPGAAARIIAETGSGVTVPDDDVQAVVAQLRRIANGEFRAELVPSSLEHYSYPHVAEQMAEAVETAIRRSAARRARSA
jgi:glycosyltransferase involved in cell wall biosynthesis